nr:EAL domain-containing protein [Musicola keenii]
MRRLVAILTFLAMLAIGCGAIYYHNYQSDIQDTNASAVKAVGDIETIFNDAQRVVNLGKTLLTVPCDTVVIRKLNLLAAIENYLRTISLVRNDIVYCSSLFGVDNRPAALERFYKGQLALLPGNSVTPNKPLVMYMETTENGSVAAGIHGIHLFNILNSLSKQRDLYLRVGSTWLSRDGMVEPFDERTLPNYVEVPSRHYYFSILYAADDNYTLVDFWDQEKMTLLIVFLIALGSGMLAYKYTSRITSPVEALKRAIRNQEIVPFYQPVISTESRELYGVEVLARWHHPKTGFIPPDVFIPLSEQSGLIIPLTRLLMDRVINDLISCQDMLPDDLHIGINISAQHCQYEKFIDDCKYFIDALGTRKIRLMVEITEREKIEITPTTLRFFQNLKAAGILIALDDFGTGYSNFDYLRQLQADLIKIDQSFISMINENSQSTPLVNCVIDLAQNMNLKTIAEGVETEFQAEFLSEKNIDYLQGYLFSRPLPFDELVKTWLQKS